VKVLVQVAANWKSEKDPKALPRAGTGNHRCDQDKEVLLAHGTKELVRNLEREVLQNLGTVKVLIQVAANWKSQKDPSLKHDLDLGRILARGR
jgi:hypothetical protein